MPSSKSTTNSIEKACAVLRVLGQFDTGLRLVEVASAAGLNKATTLRILECLAENGLIRRYERRRRYVIAPSIAKISERSRAGNLRSVAHPSLLRLAEFSDDTATLSVRCGYEALYLDQEFGRFPIRVDTLGVGRRRPLGIGAGGLALLASLDDAGVDRAIATTRKRLPDYPKISLSYLAEQVAVVRDRGYSLVLNLIYEEMGGIATCIRLPSGECIGALSIIAPSTRILEREHTLAKMLRTEAQQIGFQMKP